MRKARGFFKSNLMHAGTGGNGTGFRTYINYVVKDVQFCFQKVNMKGKQIFMKNLDTRM